MINEEWMGLIGFYAVTLLMTSGFIFLWIYCCIQIKRTNSRNTYPYRDHCILLVIFGIMLLSLCTLLIATLNTDINHVNQYLFLAFLIGSFLTGIKITNQSILPWVAVFSFALLMELGHRTIFAPPRPRFPLVDFSWPMNMLVIINLLGIAVFVLNLHNIHKDILLRQNVEPLPSKNG